MSKIKVLIEGYAKEVNGDEYASSSVTLICDHNLNILVDTGMNRELLIDSLKKEELAPADINYIVLTHTHLDHCLLVGIFENAKILDDSLIYSFDGKIVEHEKKIPGTDIEIISTPGHDQFHCAVLVDTDEFGKVAISADLFWWADSKEQKIDTENLLNLDDPYLKDKKALYKSRKKVLDIADYIIPGHGKAFPVGSGLPT
jgi:glyoxylase-like metal-dependent hydrolase (beta-lactamase superfamily II)